jgi:hypothetical protein
MYSGNPMLGFSKPSIAASDPNTIAWIATDWLVFCAPVLLCKKRSTTVEERYGV